jgi:hypothetical protein
MERLTGKPWMMIRANLYKGVLFDKYGDPTLAAKDPEAFAKYVIRKDSIVNSDKPVSGLVSKSSVPAIHRWAMACTRKKWGRTPPGSRCTIM